MKILLVSNMYPSEDFPSFGVFVKNTEAILTDEGFTVDKAVVTKSIKKSQKIAAYLGHYANVLRKGLTGNYDVIYVHYAAHNAFPLLLLKKLKPSVKIMTNVHGSDVVPEVASQEKFQPYVKKLLQQSTMIITPSHYYKELVHEKYAVTTPIEIFPSGGVNSAVFYPNPGARQRQLEQLALDSTMRYFGYVGRMDVGKGWDHLLKGFSAFLEQNPAEKSKTRLIMVGSGKDDDAFFQMRSDLGLDDVVVHFPLMKHQDLAAIYNIIELFIFPTTRKGESLGLVGLEAMACGTPILASRIGGILDYVQDGANSWLFTAGEWEDLVKQLELYNQLTMEEKQQIAKAAYETAQNYDQRKIQSKLSAIFHNLELTK
ncbi:glycosyltransferase family 4 protein [Planococcus sp. S3-L1]|uniref:glycosyltransferase family 4 protein n=1 Tax=Planococcus sp. S3-L1 TaxID=3046200 RepID=UPI0024BA1055|nr:glycosyltransferase family 4 protein [Planococcus sp. S3-L1]MDJ0330450.1 glycosyltransferase family 4 protein [Planococcus sp. S3-L1]